MLEGFGTLSTFSLVTQVRDQMLRALTNGGLLPGQRISEGEIAQQFGVSRGPVREAARLLEQRGLLVSLPRRGFFVREFEAREIEDLYELREWIEVAAVRAAVKRAKAADLKALNGRHRQVVAAARGKRQPELVDAIVDFHRSICALAGNQRLMRLFDEIAIEVSQILSVLGVALDERGMPLEVQASLLDALRRRDAGHAEREMRRFVRQARTEVLEHYWRRRTSDPAHPQKNRRSLHLRLRTARKPVNGNKRFETEEET